MSSPDKRLWTFIVHGGEPIRLHPKGNVPEEHDGGRSVFKFVLTEEKAKQTQAILEQHGCNVVARTEGMDDAQKAEREKLAGAFKETAVFPTERCPECAFFDPVHPDGYCGAEVWPAESIETVLRTLPKATGDLNLCPLEKGSKYLT